MVATLSSSRCAFLSGTAIARSQPRSQARRSHSRQGIRNVESFGRPFPAKIPSALTLTPVQAKYGDESQFFDLDDLENTAGSWDLYGQQDERRYPGLQAEFFERAAAPFATRRETVYAFVTAVGFLGLATWGAKGSKDVKLPITVGPKKGGEKGPRGRL